MFKPNNLFKRFPLPGSKVKELLRGFAKRSKVFSNVCCDDKTIKSCCNSLTLSAFCESVASKLYAEIHLQGVSDGVHNITFAWWNGFIWDVMGTEAVTFTGGTGIVASIDAPIFGVSAKIGIWKGNTATGQPDATDTIVTFICV